MLVIYSLAILLLATLVNTLVFIRLISYFSLASILNLLDPILEPTLDLAINLYNIILQSLFPLVLISLLSLVSISLLSLVSISLSSLVLISLSSLLLISLSSLVFISLFPLAL